MAPGLGSRFCRRSYFLNGGAFQSGFVSNLDIVEDADGKRNYQLSSGNDELRAISIESDGRVVAAGFTRIGMNHDIRAMAKS